MLSLRNCHGKAGIALIGETSSCTYDGGNDDDAALSATVPAGLGNPLFQTEHNGPDSKFHCTAQMNMLGKQQHNIGNVSVVTVAQAIGRVNNKAVAAGSPPPLPLSGTLLGASINGPTSEEDKAAAVALAAKSTMTLMVLGDSEKSCGEWGDRTTLALPQDQPELLRRVLATGTKPLKIIIIIIIIFAPDISYFLTTFRLYEVVSLHRRVIACKYRKIL